LFLFGASGSGALLMDASFSATSAGTLGLGRVCPGGACLPWWKYALDFSDVATPVHGHALYLKQETRPVQPGFLHVSIEHAGCAGQ
jgi:hypothetical protein